MTGRVIPIRRIDDDWPDPVKHDRPRPQLSAVPDPHGSPVTHAASEDEPDTRAPEVQALLAELRRKLPPGRPFSRWDSKARRGHSSQAKESITAAMARVAAARAANNDDEGTRA